MDIFFCGFFVICHDASHNLLQQSDYLAQNKFVFTFVTKSCPRQDFLILYGKASSRDSFVYEKNFKFYICLIKLHLRYDSSQSIKTFQKKTFNFIITDKVSHQGVCFSPKKHNYFTSIEEQQTSNSGIKLKKFRMNGNDNILANGFTFSKKNRASFREKKILEKRFH